MAFRLCPIPLLTHLTGRPIAANHFQPWISLGMAFTFASQTDNSAIVPSHGGHLPLCTHAELGLWLSFSGKTPTARIDGRLLDQSLLCRLLAPLLA
jgi:hypothetical protein